MAKKITLSDGGYQKSKYVKGINVSFKYVKPSEGFGMGKKRKSSPTQHSISEIPRKKVTDLKKTIKAVHPRSIVPQTAVAPYVADMEVVTTILGRLVRPSAVQPWLNRRLPALGRRRPVDVIRSGGVNKVIELLTQVEEGLHT